MEQNTMNGTEQQDFGERMERLEKQQALMAADITQIKQALIGGFDGRGGFSRRIERNEERIIQVENWRTKHEQEAAKLVDIFDERITDMERQLLAWNAQLKLLAWAGGGGGLAGILSLIVTLIRVLGA